MADGKKKGSNNTKLYVAIGVIIVVVLVLVAFSTMDLTPAQDNQPVNSTQIAQMASIAENNTLANQVKAGIATQDVPASVIGSPLLKFNGKPGILYIGADYCPYCAATRWSLIIALMRFGTFSNLRYMTSDPSDVFPNTVTFTFYNATYSSNYISFVGVETLTNTKQPLQQPNQTEISLANKYDTAQGQPIPFIDFGNRDVQVGAIYSPGGVLTGKDWQQVISLMGNGSTVQSQAIIGGANQFTAAICSMDNNTPSSVCDQPYVTALQN
jgi:hypothetical protein